MRSRPPEVSDAAVAEALRAWGIQAARLTYAPVGFGDHHWKVVGADKRRWFLSLAEPERKPMPCAEDGRDAAFAALRRSMACARALSDAGVAAVVAPQVTAEGETVVPVGDRWALSVFPHVEGATGDFGEEPSTAARQATIALLASLHAVAPPAGAPRIPWDPPARRELERALGALDASWHGGPYAEPARTALREAEAAVRAALARFDAQADALADPPPAVVVTHGEPHPGNLISAPDGRLHLVDWDTVGLSVPERDLWSVVRDTDDLALYARLTGNRPRADLLELFRMRWDLGDIGELLGWFRASHGAGEDLADGFRELRQLLARLAG